MARGERIDTSSAETMKHRLWRYGPLVFWCVLIFVGSTSLMSGSNTNPFLHQTIAWLLPNAGAATIYLLNSIIRKGAHFTEYAILGLLAVRAFRTSSHSWLREHWFLTALLFVVVYSLSDEFHQGFVSSRTPSIYDCMVDSFGGLAALTLWAVMKRRRSSFESPGPENKLH